MSSRAVIRFAFFGTKIAAVAVTVVLGFTWVTTSTNDATAWLKDRRTRFAAYRTAHPNPDAEIADINAKTAALIAAYAPPRAAADAELDNDSVQYHALVIWRVSNTPVELWDGADFPKMIVVPAGEYTMGSPASEPNRQANEGPRHRVRIGYSFAVSQYTITMGEYARFVADTHHDVGEACFTIEHGEYRLREGRDWRRVGFTQTGNSPAGVREPERRPGLCIVVVEKDEPHLSVVV